MADAAKKVRAQLRKARAAFERNHEKLGATRAAHRKSFENVPNAGLSMRGIAEETGLFRCGIWQARAK